ncbi:MULTISPECIES: DUF2637 domain-containing protein [unclassified Streptomyces]|uniref:DUF2637 domain-containing protein n=1 Tax=unclassified Streptomyces TaxID=2593676 RepID=UPI0037FC23A5
MTTTAEPRTAAPKVPAPVGPAPTPGPEPVPPGAAPAAPGGPRNRSGRMLRFAMAAGMLGGGAVVAGIGFAASYTALRKLAAAHGFEPAVVPWVPIGVDAGIIVLLAADLFMAHRKQPWPVLRLSAHLLTLATIYFNASSVGSGDLVGAGMHAVMPLLFVGVVEAARRAIIKAAHVERPDTVPLYRWVLSPWKSWALFRRMRLWEIRSYATAVKLERERTLYRAMLEREYGKNWRRKAPAPRLLPLTMAPYGLSVDEALALPDEHDAREQLRKDKAEAARLDRAARAKAAAAQARIAELKTEASVVAAEHDFEATTGAAAARARAARTEAETQAEAQARAARRALQEAEHIAVVEKEALDSVTAAEARERAAEAELRAAEESERAAGVRLRAAEADEEAAAAEARAEAAVAKAAEDRERAAVANLRAAGAEEEAAEVRLRAAEAEERALAAEELTRLTPRQRDARKVARLVLTEAGGVVERLPLSRIMEVLGVSETTAGDRRKDARALLDEGYQP